MEKMLLEDPSHQNPENYQLLCITSAFVSLTCSILFNTFRAMSIEKTTNPPITFGDAELSDIVLVVEQQEFNLHKMVFSLF